FLSISAIENASVSKGVNAVYPVTVTNLGIDDELVKLSGECPEGLVCSFDPVSYETLYPTQVKLFNLVVDTTNADSGNYSIRLDTALGTQTTACDVRYLSLEVKPVTPSPGPRFVATLEPSANQSSRPGDYVEYAISIFNNADEKGYANFKTVGAFAANTVFSASSIELAAFETKRVTAKVRIPPGAPGGTFDQLFQISAASAGGVRYPLQLYSQIFVFAPTIDLQLENEPVDCITTQHAGETVWEMALRNNGEVEGLFSLSLEGVSEALESAKLSADVLEVVSGDKQYFRLVFKPKKSVALDTYYLNLLVKYLDFAIMQKQICFTVTAVTDFYVKKLDEYAVIRSIVTPIEFTVVNNGSVSNNFELQVLPPATMLVQALPQSFSLSPGEERLVRLIASTSLERTPLGRNTIKVMISDKTGVKQAHYFNVNVVPSNRSGQSFFSISIPELRVTPGAPGTAFIEVKNSKNAPFHDVSLTLSGIPSTWYSIQPSSRDVPENGSAVYQIDFSIPSNPELKPYELEFTASSALEGESVKQNASLLLLAPVRSIQASALDAQYFLSGDKREILVSITVQNNGTVGVKSVKLSSTGYAVFSQPSLLDLAPGEQKTFTASIVVPSDLPTNSTVALLLNSPDGAYSEVRIIAHPEEKTAGSSWILYVIIALILLVAAIFLLSRREREAEEAIPSERGTRERLP
ncbi:hypothetical protein H0N96_01960, partial [Candidatus Micrarchaeota archaeon]|nr:hypothetical protein [Candidatus Micrarchaeota archaeon]